MSRKNLYWGSGNRIPITSQQIEDMKINKPTEIITSDEEKVQFSILKHIRGEGSKRIKITLYKSQAEIAFARYKKDGKQPKWEKE